MNVIEKIDKEIAELRKKKQAIQKKCNHPSTTESSWHVSENIMTGRDEEYGYNYTCDLCGHTWSKRVR